MKTKDVAKQLGISYSRLLSFIRSDKIPAPTKDSSDDYVWSDKDVNGAQKVLEAKARKLYPKLVLK